MVVTAICDDLVGALARPARPSCDGADPVQEWEQLRDIVSMAAGQRGPQRHAETVDQMMLGARAGAVDR